MAFPTVVGTATWAAGAGGVTPHMATMPAGILAGDLIVVAWMRNGVNNSGTLDGKWTDLAYAPRGIASSIGSRVAYAIADGTEAGATLTFAAVSGGARGCSVTTVIRGYTGLPEITAVPDANTSSSANSDPPALAPTFGSADTLWLAIVQQNGAQSLSSIPANYGSNVPIADANATIEVARRNLTAAAEDPGPFIWSAVTASIASTLAVAGITAPAAHPRAFGTIV